MSIRDLSIDLRSSQRIGSTSSQPGYMPLREAAWWVGVSPKTIRRWITGGLPSYRGNARGRVLVRPDDIQQFLVKEKADQIDLGRIVEEVMEGLKAGS